MNAFPIPSSDEFHTIPVLGPIVATVRQLDERFHELIAKELAGTITADETAELDGICHAKENVGVPMIAPEMLKKIMGEN